MDTRAQSGLSSHLMTNPLRTPQTLGFSMPAEWEEHEATWLAWPHNPTDWPDKLDIVRWVYGEIVRKIAPGEIVRMVVDSRKDEKLARSYLQRAGADTGRVEFVVHPTNRGWTRDSGPVFVRRRSAKKTETAIVHFHFNAWAKYPDWRKDRRLPVTAAKHLGKRLFDARGQGKEFVLEGGGIDVNGLGTLITTEECYLDPVVQVRNPGVGRHEFEAILQAYLGAGNVLWLAGGVTGDDTHGHVDDICRFVFCTEPGTKLSAVGGGAQVVFEVDDSRPLYHAGWSVVVRGTAREITDEEELDKVRRGPLRSWATHSREHWVRISIDEVTGRRIPGT